MSYESQYCIFCRKWQPNTEWIARCVKTARCGSDVERTVRWVARTHAKHTDDLVSIFHEAFTKHRDIFTSEDLQRLSRMHAKHGKSIGADGYAMTLVWSTLVDVVI